MSTIELPLASIQLDHGTQVRASIDDTLVDTYAELMAEGALFPPIAVFFDHHIYYLADGFHRYLAAQKIARSALRADVYPGTQSDALWFALGANRTNGQRLNARDYTHAVKLALVTWPTRTNREIAAQVGCSTSLVSKVIKHVTTNTGVAPDIRGLKLLAQQKRDAVREMVQAGAQSTAIQKTLHAHSTLVADVRRELGLVKIDYSRKGGNERRERMRQLATEGYTSTQIAHEVGMSVAGCRNALKHANIIVPGDAVTRNSRHHNSNRIMQRIVEAADDLTAGAELIDFNVLDPRQFPDWITSLRNARIALGTFIKRLQQQERPHEVAFPQAI